MCRCKRSLALVFQNRQTMQLFVCDNVDRDQRSKSKVQIMTWPPCVDFPVLLRFGRRIMLLTSYLSGMLFALTSAFATSFLMFAALRFLTGFCMTGIAIVSVVLCTVILDTLMAFCVHLNLYLKCCFIHSSRICVSVCPCNLHPGVEWVDVQHRKMVGIIESFSWTFGSIFFVPIAYLVTDWRWLIVSVTLPVLLGIFTWR